jgi:hypothetical protein
MTTIRYFPLLFPEQKNSEVDMKGVEKDTERNDYISYNLS